MNTGSRKYLPGLVTGLLVVVAACTPSVPTATPALSQQLSGDWLNQREPFVIHFDPDGTYVLARAEALANPVDSGTMTIEGTTFTLTTGQADSLCQPGDVIISEVEVIDVNEFHGVVLEDTCTPESVGSDATWIRCVLKPDPNRPGQEYCEPVK